MSSDETQTTPAGAGEPATTKPARRARWKSIVLEILLWAAVAIATAVFLVYASERWLPSNF